MARVSVYLPDDLAKEARDAGLNVSALTQSALRATLASRLADRWLDEVDDLGATGISHEQAVSAVRSARAEDFGAVFR